ncbi:aminotransferase class V-fold PLP-dependent enzyme [Desulfosporosinus sp. PR]|uniref:aminotransferase class V-fold PLP-dependent enzyme n=1 Tax=Candidatus Desulfosporosinus nitrosoreducens TaxID=3401928 RepID=UPI002800651C|nr:aminotransferase class V-fold PLP-dependent enzyme [Desulfosporosinus sp. PR]MDQ7093736.1 aminotransferase class V-fold PLP-dependent enzyme [Desulfosporosinus sp. PR]
MKEIYLDNAATSYPKAPGVSEAISFYLSSIGCNVNRGAYKKAYQAEEIVFETRELLCRLFHFDKPEHVIFTKNITESLNVIIKGLLKPGDHVIVSSMEHNAVMRPLNSLKNRNLEVTTLECNTEGELSEEQLKLFPSLVKPHTKAVIMTAASNVCGTMLPLKEVGKICREHHIFFIVDSAQTAGFSEIDMNLHHIDALAFTGHKGLLGPQGIGGFLINESLAAVMDSLIEGGTGSFSELETQPAYLPDKFEAGTLNVPGIFGLNAALKYLFQIGIGTIREQELHLLDLFMLRLLEIPQIRLVGKRDLRKRTSIVSIDLPNHDCSELSYRLYKEYGIMTRSGLHCAPSAHRTLGTFPQGTLRFSFNHFNTDKEALQTIDCVRQSLKLQVLSKSRQPPRSRPPQ